MEKTEKGVNQKKKKSIPPPHAVHKTGTGFIRTAGFAHYNSPTKSCIRRIHSDLKQLAQDPIEGILVDPDETRVNVCHALIMGPTDTPYEFGLFYFVLEFPNDYPHSPPQVTLQTTGGGGNNNDVRFNPNLYESGKVCLSILGTWDGPSWTPVHTIGSVLLSIRSLMNSNPLHNEPGFESLPTSDPKHRHYNVYVRHETLRVAMLDMVDLARNNSDTHTINNKLVLPKHLADFVLTAFVELAECCKYVCDEYSFLDGTPFQICYYKKQGIFDFKGLRNRICEMEQCLVEKGKQQED